MKHNRLITGLAAGLFVLTGSASAAVVGSKHDLTSATGTAAVTTNVTAEVCVFCHTPHGSDSSAPAPLWNKSLPAAGSFTLYDSSFSASIDGTVDLAGSGVSLACLSCHDGSQAMDTVLNAPTSGGNYNYDPAGAEIDGTAITSMDADATNFPSPVPNIGKNLQNDHPVGIQYAGGGLTWAAIAAGNQVSDSANDKAFNDPNWDGNRLWVASGATTKALPLYKDAGNNPLVECASCHDPHGGVANTPFLRVSNAASAVCTACHVK